MHPASSHAQLDELLVAWWIAGHRLLGIGESVQVVQKSGRPTTGWFRAVITPTHFSGLSWHTCSNWAGEFHRHQGFALVGHFSLYEVSQGIDLGWGACDRGNGVGVDAVQVASEVGGSLR